MSSSRSSRSPSTTPTSRPTPLPAESASTVKTHSPLNPAATPTKTTVALPKSDDDAPSQAIGIRQRVRSASFLTAEKGKSSLSGSPDSGHSASSSPPVITTRAAYDGETMKSTFRERSRSPGRGSDDLGVQEADGASSRLTSSWWGEKHVARPWQDTPKRKRTLPPEHREALESTRQKVAQAVISALGTGAEVLHEALYVGVELLDFVPVPGLQTAAKTLLSIWDAAQQVDMNCLSCFRLTERCADILISVRQEVFDAGDVVRQELEAPILKLEESFLTTHRFMLKQAHRPWLKRYLKRDEILRDIADCDSALRDALALFNVSIQIRILKQLQESEKKRQYDSKVLSGLAGLVHELVPNSHIVASETETTTEDYTSDGSTDHVTESITTFATTPNALGLTGLETDGSMTPTATRSTSTSSTVIPRLQEIHNAQNAIDATLDMDDLRRLMRAALQTSSDAEMVEVLQIGRQEMPDAIKTLQRALERLAEREGEEANMQGSAGVVVGKVVRKVSVKEVDGKEVGLKRSKTVVSVDSSSSSEDSRAGTTTSTERRRDTLDWEFIESGIDCLRRMSRGVQSLPSWTITKYEVDRDEKIGIGFFSDVFKGTWRGRTVAIKVLAESTPRKLFVREVAIWKTIRHPNVLQLYGASSATGEPPWFFVSPYLKHGSLVEYLKRVEHNERPDGPVVGLSAPAPVSPFRSPAGRAVTLPAPRKTPRNGGLHEGGLSASASSSSSAASGSTTSRENQPIQREWDLFRFMHEIAKGMEYLHGKGVLHGDLKCANVLVDDKYRCVISDFGQSEMKSEAYRISGTAPPHGTLRWQSPELMSGQSMLTTAVDVWAFAICCVEILTMGRIPWALMDDDSVRHFVLKDNTRPPIPRSSRFNTPGLQDVLRACWATLPEQRPQFSKVAKDLKLLRKSFGNDVFESPRLPTIEDVPENTSSPSPDMRPVNLPQFLQGAVGTAPNDILVGSLNSDGTFHTARDSTPSPAHGFYEEPREEDTVANDEFKMPQPVLYTPGPSNPSSRTSSVRVPLKYTDEALIEISKERDGYESPPPIDERAAQIKNERRYRLLLTHEYSPSLVLPLWTPTAVELGAVGYLSKPRGEFITLFNAYSPIQSAHPAIKVLPSIDGYGRAPTNTQPQDRRTVGQKIWDRVGGTLNFGKVSVIRRYSYPLKAGHKVAYMVAEITEFKWMENRDPAKKWFQLHVDAVMQAYAKQHQIQKEELYLVTGTLRAPNYALFLSHSHPEGHAHFSIYANTTSGQPWGTFTTDTAVPQDTVPLYDTDEDETPRLSASKVSNHGGPLAAVLLARLRFKPDVLEPTSK